RLLTTTEQDHGFHLVTRLEEANSALHLGFVVVLINFETETNLFEDRVRLVASSFFRLLRSLVLELSVVHDLGDRRLGIGGNLNQIEVCLLRQTQGCLDFDNADLLTGRADKSDFRNADAVVCTGIADAFLLYSTS